MDSPTPHTVQATGTTHFQDWVETPDTVVGTMIYPKNFTVLYHSSMIGSLEGGGIVFRGDKAMLKLTRDGFALYPEGSVKQELTHLPEARIEVRRSGKRPNSHVRAGVEAANTSHLCNRAMLEKRIVSV